MQAPAAEGLDVGFPLHAIGHVDADGFAEDVDECTMGEVVSSYSLQVIL